MDSFLNQFLKQYFFKMDWDILMQIFLSVFEEDNVVEDLFWEGCVIIDGCDIIFSYMFKNCLFYVVNDLKSVDKNIS